MGKSRPLSSRFQPIKFVNLVVPSPCEIQHIIMGNIKSRPNDCNISPQHIATTLWAQHAICLWPPCCYTLGIGSSLKMVKFEPTTPNMLQHIATRWPNTCNMLRPTILSCNMLHQILQSIVQSIGQSLSYFIAPAITSRIPVSGL